MTPSSSLGRRRRYRAERQSNIGELSRARVRGLKIFGIVGRDGGYTRKVGDESLIPTVI